MGGLLRLSTVFYPLLAQNKLNTPPNRLTYDSILMEKYSRLASVYSDSGQMDKTYILLQKGLTLSIRSKNERSRAIFLSKIALYYKKRYQTDSIDAGLNYAREAIIVFQRQKEWKSVSEMMYLMCKFYLDKNDPARTIQELIALVRFNEKHRLPDFNGPAYNLLAHTFHRLNDTINEKKYILIHLDHAEKQNSDYQRMHGFDVYGSFLSSQKKFRTAHIYFTKAYRIAKRLKGDQVITEILLNMGLNLISLKEYNKSLNALRLAEKTALKHIKDPGWNAIVSIDYSYLSSLFLATGKPRKALDYARRSFALVQNEPRRYEYLIRALKNQIAAQKLLGRYRDALNSYEQLQTVIQSLDLNRDREIAKGIEARYQFDKVEREKESAEKNVLIKDLELQNQEKQQKLLSALLGLFALLLCGGFWFYQKNQAYNNRISKKNQQLEVLNETKDKLFGIIGHDLRAPVVDLINTITLLESTDLTAEQLSAQSSVLRKKAISLQTILNNLLYWAFSQRHLLRANPRLIPLKNSIEEALDSLNGLMQEKSLEVVWLTGPKNTIYADENHVQIVLYNVLHNAIKFSPYNSTIEINTTTEAPYIVLRVTNKGKEFEWEGTAGKNAPALSHKGTLGEKGTGLGLLVCAELMKLNQGTIRAQRKPAEGTTLVLAFSPSV